MTKGTPKTQRQARRQPRGEAKTAPAGQEASRQENAATASAPRRRRKNTVSSKRLAELNPFGPAFEAACDLLVTALACQRAHDSAQQGAVLRPARSYIDEQVRSRFDGVRTVEQFRANFTVEELVSLSSDLRRSMTEKSRAMLDGIGNQAHSRAQREQYLMLRRGLASGIKIPCALEDLEAKLEEKSAELGHEATMDDLEPLELAYPSKAKFRQEAARLMHVNMRTIIRWDRELERKGDTIRDPRIFKNRMERTEEVLRERALAADLAEKWRFSASPRGGDKSGRSMPLSRGRRPDHALRREYTDTRDRHHRAPAAG